jgi:hypothetical protein
LSQKQCRGGSSEEKVDWSQKQCRWKSSEENIDWSQKGAEDELQKKR